MADGQETDRSTITYPTRIEVLEPQLLWRDARGSHSYLLFGHKVLGSAEGADVIVTAPGVARLHAAIEVLEDGVWIRDLGTQEGVHVNGIRVNEARVPDGATIGVGSASVQVYYSQNSSEVNLWPEDNFGLLRGRSAVMRSLFARLYRFAQQDDTVLIQGENGTGKELIARAVHDASTRSERPYVVVDCSALSETMLEDELFGHAKHAFTDARKERVGALESAHGGTVFLDEIGEMPLSMQPKLLRAIEGRTVRRIGENEHRKINVRFIAATNRDLAEMVNAGSFREDLYFRLAVLPVNVPPLRARKDDIPLLAEQFLQPGQPHPFTPELMEELKARSWRGNVRELKNFVARATALGAREALAMLKPEAMTPELDAQEEVRRRRRLLPTGAPTVAPPPLPAEPSTQSAPVATSETTSDSNALPSVPTNEPFKIVRDRWLEHLEREYMRVMVQRFGRDTNAIAAASGLDRSYVYRLLNKHHLWPD